MAKQEIERFGVKPSGLLAKWRYAKVMVDELGNVSYENIPGKETINQDKVSDYKKNDRRYRNGDLITSFCNRDTFTNFRIYAQDAKPFAYTQTDLNAIKCGYQVPIEEPFIAPNPYGNPQYGFYAYLNYCSSKNQPINIRIYKRNFIGAATKINNGGVSPAVISYKNSDEDKFSPLRTCELNLTLVSDGLFNLEQFYTEDEREFKIQVIVAGVTKFFGFGTATDAAEQFQATPYDVTLRATDGLGALKEIDYPLPIGSKTDIQQKFLEIICYCLAMTNLNLNISTICNLYEIKMLNGLDDDPLTQASVNPLRMVEKGQVLSCYDVLTEICLQFGAFLVQNNGVWHFVRQAELANDVLRKRNYTHQGFLIGAEQFYNKREATCKGTDISILDDSPIIRIGNAYKRAEAVVEFGEIPFLIFNGDFEQWTGSNFPGWTRYSGIDISRVEKQIVTTTGKIPSGNFALQFNKPADNSKYIESSKIQVLKGDKITLSFNVSKTSQNTPGIITTPDGRPIRGGNDTTGTTTRGGVAGTTVRNSGIAFKMRIKLGEYYLTNPNADNEYTWVRQLVTCTIMVNNTSDSLDSYTVELDLPDAPEQNYMSIQLFGFVVTGTYYPVYIDNISLNRSSENKIIGQVLYITQQDGFYTSKPDPIKLMFGDYTGVSATVVNSSRPTRAGTTEIKNDQYAIKTSDGSYSAAWYEYGASANPVPIGLTLTRSILKAYQKPFRFLEGSFLGDNISYLDIFNVNLPDNTDFNNRIFALLSGDFDLVSGEVRNANYVEIFSKPGKTVDIVTPGKVGDTSPPMSQNPNPAPVTTAKIFTQEFTNEFM